MDGSVIFQKISHGVAPSTLAISYREDGTDCRAESGFPTGISGFLYKIEPIIFASHLAKTRENWYTIGDYSLHTASGGNRKRSFTQ